MAVRSAPPERVSRVRRLPLPVTEPPFDDELGLVVLGGDPRASGEAPAPGTPVQGVLAFELEPDAGLEELLRPIGLGAPVTADSLWLRDPGPGRASPTPRARRTGAEAEHASGPGRTSARGAVAGHAGNPGSGRAVDAPARVGVAGTAGRPDRNRSTAARDVHTRITGEVGGVRATDREARPDTTIPAGGTGSASHARGADTGDVRQPGGTGQVGDAHAARQAGLIARDGATDGAGRVGDGRRTAGGHGQPVGGAGVGTRRRPGGAGARGTGSDELPDPRRWVARLAQSAVECLHGRRPVQQLVRWTAEPVYRDLSRRANAAEAAPAERPRIRSLRVCRVTASVAEASVVVQLGRAARSVAVAVRLEADGGRWVCTAFDLVEPGPAAARRAGLQAAQRASHASSNATA